MGLVSSSGATQLAEFVDDGVADEEMDRRLREQLDREKEEADLAALKARYAPGEEEDDGESDREDEMTLLRRLRSKPLHLESGRSRQKALAELEGRDDWQARLKKAELLHLEEIDAKAMSSSDESEEEETRQLRKDRLLMRFGSRTLSRSSSGGSMLGGRSRSISPKHLSGGGGGGGLEFPKLNRSNSSVHGYRVHNSNSSFSSRLRRQTSAGNRSSSSMLHLQRAASSSSSSSAAAAAAAVSSSSSSVSSSGASIAFAETRSRFGASRSVSPQQQEQGDESTAESPPPPKLSRTASLSNFSSRQVLSVISRSNSGVHRSRSGDGGSASSLEASLAELSRGGSDGASLPAGAAVDENGVPVRPRKRQRNSSRSADETILGAPNFAQFNARIASSHRRLVSFVLFYLFMDLIIHPSAESLVEFVISSFFFGGFPVLIWRQPGSVGHVSSFLMESNVSLLRQQISEDSASASGTRSTASLSNSTFIFTRESDDSQRLERERERQALEVERSAENIVLSEGPGNSLWGSLSESLPDAPANLIHLTEQDSSSILFRHRGSSNSNSQPLLGKRTKSMSSSASSGNGSSLPSRNSSSRGLFRALERKRKGNRDRSSSSGSSTMLGRSVSTSMIGKRSQ